MTIKEAAPAKESSALQNNLQKVEQLSERLIKALSNKSVANPGLQGPNPDLMIKASTAYWQDAVNNPSKIFEHQVSFWSKSVQHFIEAQEALAGGQFKAPEDKTPTDRRFSNPLWQSHPYFNFVKQQYMLSSEAIANSVKEIEGLSDKDRTRLEYFSQQIVDLMAPTNFLATNPDALERAVETEGESLVRGLENLVRDIEANDGELLVTLADREAFKVGGNIATTPGQVVYRNRMLELIQYTPTTEKVHEVPLIIFPPWINKFYVMDLKEQNSLIKWLVDQGYTLFVVSWVNPDPDMADVGVDTYVKEGYIEAIEQVKAITKQKQVNAVGYCIAGTTLSLTLALLQKLGDKSIKSATFYTTLTDFSDQGEFEVFLGDDFVDAIEQEVEAKGCLQSYIMSRTFSFLRPNDLIYSPAIRSYMMGEAPPAFDLLYWNGDSTNLPARMAIEYLRGLCQDNKLAKGEFEIDGHKLSLKDVKVPVCAIACETDHIAAWKPSFNGISQMGSRSKTFILSESGHIAGIINPPSKKKYGHYTSKAPIKDADVWLAEGTYNEGSWWPTWDSWLSKKSGKKVPARQPGGKNHPPICPAPGTYVLKK
ncbi:class I poly(R)-hydroxyalkanoic acid synthase [Actibacterium pelagium]|uniref:Class I poly(R)-hydroxyalkanoic acid synthase n=1 Tax=Actibacterium pelagium TaxID=2029103 RepID=A0A917EL42_9RHOB|nr:class I poly(R)-hydroxyalkanoic acid synthase [Actibacterium pelagium]GGE50554.1 class I poly(R)-hydroxyalkanoic acid synthase [Actibacterium pelagium]